MGTCSISKMYKVSSVTQVLDPLIQYRIEVHSYLKKIHQVNLNCKKAIETCILNREKHKASIIKAKQFYLRKISIFMQECVKKIDSAIETKKNTDFKKKMLEEMKNSWIFVDTLLVADDLDIIINSKSDSLDVTQLEKSLQKIICEYQNEISYELESDIEKIQKLNGEGKYNRTKYVKQ